MRFIPSVALLLTGIGALLLSGCGSNPPPAPTPTPTKTPMAELMAVEAATPAAMTPESLPTALVLTAEPLPEPQASEPEPAAQEPAVQEPVPQAVAAPAPVPAPAAPPAVAPEPAPEPPAPPAEPEPPAEPVAIAPPLQGGDWSMDAGFYSWASPYENFGGFIPHGWSALVKAYDPNSNPSNAPRLNENSWEVNVHSGQRSQEISFDFRSGEAGLYRTIDVTPGHRYRIEAWAKYAPSPSGLYLDLGVDLGGDGNFEAPSVTWYPWRDMTPDHWVATQETVTATGPRMTIYLRGTHPVPEPGGNTMFDTVSVTDLGP